ncbi:hypothetical protein DFA_05303, partial [Cavenderia fasciculata]
RVKMELHHSIPGVVTKRYISETKGRGVFTEKSFSSGEVIFSEAPLFSVQHVYNRTTAWTCAHCFRFLGSLNKQLNHYRRVFKLVGDKAGDFIETDQNPYDYSTGVVSCFAKCGEKYCSEQCRETAFNRHHQLLCVGGDSDESSPLYKFKLHAIDSNELFFLGGQIIASLVSRVMTANDPNLASVICQEFLKQYCHRAWWEVRIDDNFTEQEARTWSAESLDLLRKYLYPILTSHPLTNNQTFIETLLSMEFYSHILGMLEMNDNSIGFSHPLEKFRRHIDDTNKPVPEQFRAHSQNAMKKVVEALRQYHAENEDDCDDEECNHQDHDMADGNGHAHGHAHGHGHGHSGMDTEEEEEMREMESEQKMNDMEDDDDEDYDVFPSFDGFGMFGLQAMINHSCEPNCLVVFDNGSNFAHIKALRDIQAGEELYHSYIDENTPFEEREQELITYGFKCICRKCVSERPITNNNNTTQQ